MYSAYGNNKRHRRGFRCQCHRFFSRTRSTFDCQRIALNFISGGLLHYNGRWQLNALLVFGNLSEPLNYNCEISESQYFHCVLARECKFLFFITFYKVKFLIKQQQVISCLQNSFTNNETFFCYSLTIDISHWRDNQLQDISRRRNISKTLAMHKRFDTHRLFERCLLTLAHVTSCTNLKVTQNFDTSTTCAS